MIKPKRGAIIDYPKSLANRCTLLTLPNDEAAPPVNKKLKLARRTCKDHKALYQQEAAGN
jgi:hypothetical protein